MLRALLAAVAVALAAATTAAAFVPADPLVAKQWYLQDDHAFDAWAEPPTTLQPVKVAVIDSGVDCSLPDFQGRILDARSFVGGDPCSDVEGHGTFVAGIIAANLDSEGIVGIAYTAQLLDREGRAQRRPHPARCGSRRDSLGRRLGCARDQPQPLRAARPRAPGERQLFRRGGGRRRVRGEERRAPRRSRRQRRRRSDRAVAVRRLSRGAAARARRERADEARQRPRLLEPRHDLQRPLGAGLRHLLDVPAHDHLAAALVPRPGLLRLRDGRLPQSRGNLVRCATGRRSRGSALRVAALAHRRTGRVDPGAHGRRRERGERLFALRAPPRPAERLGTPRRREGGRLRSRARCRLPTSTRRTTTRVRTRTHSGVNRRRSPLRSTTTTIRATSTGSRSGRTRS